jgi:hypothetical protein
MDTQEATPPLEGAVNILGETMTVSQVNGAGATRGVVAINKTDPPQQNTEESESRVSQ